MSISNSNEFNKESIKLEWEIIFLKIESSFEEVADHLKEYNGYYGAWRDYGLLQVPTIGPCKEKDPCKRCKIASTEQKSKWEIKARKQNERYFREVMTYHNVCVTNFHQLYLSEESKKVIQITQKEIEDHYASIEREINEITLKAGDTERWIDVFYLFEPVIKTINDKSWYDLPFKPHVRCKKAKIFEGWRDVSEKISSQIFQVCDHVEDYKSDCGFHKLGTLKQPRIIPCNEENSCNKCINN